MTSRIVKVGRGSRRTDQVITTTYSTDINGELTEHVTLATPNELTETQRLRTQAAWESQKEWP